MKDKRGRMDVTNLDNLEMKLHDFASDVRTSALAELVSLEQGAVPLEPEAGVADMHCHTQLRWGI